MCDNKSKEPEIWTEITLAEASRKPYDLDKIYIPLVDENDNRYLAAVLNINPKIYNNGWVEKQLATQHILDITVDDSKCRKSSNQPIVK